MHDYLYEDRIRVRLAEIRHETERMRLAHALRKPRRMLLVAMLLNIFHARTGG